MKLRRLIENFLIGMTLAAVGASQVMADETRPAEVVVLSTLHQLHADTEGYSFEILTRVIEELSPDILAVELTLVDLDNRREQNTKQEYQASVFPLLDKHGYGTLALEPPQPRYDEIVQMFREAQQTMMEQNPQGAEVFGTYVSTLFDVLNDYWKSPETVNSRVTDMFFDAKHRFQGEVFGPKEITAWEAWNNHFLEQIVSLARSSPDKRIVVLVGAEHAYWLRAHLQNSDVLLLDTESLLGNMAH